MCPWKIYFVKQLIILNIPDSLITYRGTSENNIDITLCIDNALCCITDWNAKEWLTSDSQPLYSGFSSQATQNLIHTRLLKYSLRNVEWKRLHEYISTNLNSAQSLDLLTGEDMECCILQMENTIHWASRGVLCRVKHGMHWRIPWWNDDSAIYTVWDLSFSIG